MSIKPKNYFDKIVIGTSPLMLLVAISYAKKGFSILVVDKNENFGGCWQYHTNKNQKFESSSHLIEKYPGVYKILEEYSSVKFIPLKEKPKRILKNGLIISYQNKIVLFLTFFKLAIGYFYYCFIFLIYKTKLEEKINFKIKLNDFIKFRFKTFYENNVLYGPENGYAELIIGLLNKCKKEKVVFINAEVIKIKTFNKKWIISLSNKTNFVCEELHSTSAINFKINNNMIFKKFKNYFYKKKSVLISIKKQYIINDESYVSFLRDKYISRIHRIDQKKQSNEFLYFLVEMRSNKNFKTKELEQLISKRLLKSKIFSKNGNFNILEVFYSKYTSNSDQLIVKDIDNFTSYFSNGNLAAGIHNWLVQTNQLKNFT